MIYHRDKLETSPDPIESAVVTLYKSIPPFDVFVIATEDKHIERMNRMEAVAKTPFSKPSWIKSINKNEGVILTITSGMFRRKMDRKIAGALEYIKNEFDGLVVDHIENKKFAVFFIGIKAAKKSKAEDIETNEAIEPNENMEVKNEN
jgi:hypothetical protein